MPKIISNELRDMILKVYEFCKEEKNNRAPIIPFKKVNQRVCLATGVSLRTLSRIIKEGSLPPESRVPKKKKVRKDKILLNTDEISLLRRKVHEFYNIKKEFPTIRKLHEELKQEIGYKGSREILRRHLLEIGFRFKKSKTSQELLMEHNDLSAWGTEYLQIQQCPEEPEPEKQLPIVYLDETYILSGDTPRRCWLLDSEAVAVQVEVALPTTEVREQC